jgi:hypothetical protein
MRQLFFAAFDQSQRAAVVFVARLGYLRAGARVVSHQALKPFTPDFGDWSSPIYPFTGNSIGNCATADHTCHDG